MSASQAAASEPAPNLHARGEADMSQDQAEARGCAQPPMPQQTRGAPGRRRGRAIVLVRRGGGRHRAATAESSAGGMTTSNSTQWTDEQAVPTVALVSPQEGGEARELVLPGNVEAFDTASIHGQVSGYVQRMAQGHRRSGPSGRRAGGRRHARTRPAHRRRAKRTREGQGESGAWRR